MRIPIRLTFAGLPPRQIGEYVRGVAVRYLSGGHVMSVEYEADEADPMATFRAFARDIEKGHYDGRIIYSCYTYMRDDETNVLMVHFHESFDDAYKWGLER